MSTKLMGSRVYTLDAGQLMLDVIIRLMGAVSLSHFYDMIALIRIVGRGGRELLA